MIEPNEWNWSYAIVRTSGLLDEHIQRVPIEPGTIEAILGGPYELVELHDQHNSVLAVRRDREAAQLPWNPHYQGGIQGDVLLGKFAAGTQTFVGFLGFQTGREK